MSSFIMSEYTLALGSGVFPPGENKQNNSNDNSVTGHYKYLPAVFNENVPEEIELHTVTKLAKTKWHLKLK